MCKFETRKCTTFLVLQPEDPPLTGALIQTPSIPIEKEDHNEEHFFFNTNRETALHTTTAASRALLVILYMYKELSIVYKQRYKLFALF